MITLSLPLNLPSELQGVQLIDIRTKLPVNVHYSWEKLKGLRPISALTTIVLHHDAYPKSKSARYTDMQLAIKIAKDHIDSKKNWPTGDPGFPYDVWIRNGIIYWTNEIEVFEYGVASNNKYTANICVSGDYHNGDVLTDPDRKALYVAILMLKGVLPAWTATKGHGEITKTWCPGYDEDKVRADIIKWEKEIAFRQSQQGEVANVTETYARVMAFYNSYRDPKIIDKSLEARIFKKIELALREEGLWKVV